MTVADADATTFGPALPEHTTNPAPSDPAAASSEHKVGPEEPDSTAAPVAADAAGAIQIDLSFADAGETENPSLEPWLLEHAHAAARAAELEQAELSIAVVRDSQMAELHEQYKNVPGTTDVLTFDLGQSLPDNHIEGEIIICVDEAQRQATARGHELRHELLLYIVHGILHLLGEDDQDPTAYQHMHDKEDAILTELGLGPIFSRGDQHA